MGERLLCKQEVIGSIPFTSTNDFAARNHQEGNELGLVFVRDRKDARGKIDTRIHRQASGLLMNSSIEEFIGCNAL